MIPCPRTQWHHRCIGSKHQQFQRQHRCIRPIQLPRWFQQQHKQQLLLEIVESVAVGFMIDSFTCKTSCTFSHLPSAAWRSTPFSHLGFSNFSQSSLQDSVLNLCHRLCQQNLLLEYHRPTHNSPQVLQLRMQRPSWGKREESSKSSLLMVEGCSRGDETTESLTPKSVFYMFILSVNLDKDNAVKTLLNLRKI